MLDHYAYSTAADDDAIRTPAPPIAMHCNSTLRHCIVVMTFGSLAVVRKRRKRPLMRPTHNH